MAAPRQMTAHSLDAMKGWPSPHAVDFAAKLSSEVTIDPVYAGRVVHLVAGAAPAIRPAGAAPPTVVYEMGLPDVSRAGHMAIFLFQNSDDPDVANEGGNAATESGVWVPTAPTGVMMGLVAAGAYELEDTEFEAEATAGTYAPGDCLTATASNTVAATGGRITRSSVVAYDVPLCGVVSRGVGTNAHGRSCLYFWPTWLPRYKAEE